MALITEKREVKDFTAVALQGIGELVIEQNPDGPESLEITADSDVLARLTTQVEAGRLVLGFNVPWYDWLGWGLEWLFTPNKTIRYHLVVKQITNVSLSGAAELKSARLEAPALTVGIGGTGKIRLEEVKTGDFKLTISGAGSIHIDKLTAETASASISGTGDVALAGSAASLDGHISGAGSLKTFGLETQTASIIISGAGSAEVNASKSLTASISGTGDVKYRGAPTVSQTISGIGKVAAG